jgi:hypothetical protein
MIKTFESFGSNIEMAVAHIAKDARHHNDTDINQSKSNMMCEAARVQPCSDNCYFGQIKETETEMVHLTKSKDAGLPLMARELAKRLATNYLK